MSMLNEQNKDTFHKRKTNHTILLLTVSLVAIIFFKPEIDSDFYTIDTITYTDVEITKNPIAISSLLFVGDIMLGRGVESKIKENGTEYPLRGTAELIKEVDYAIGNFEGIVSNPHIQTPIMGFLFSIDELYLKLLKENGFDMLSLANNHSYDYGSAGLIHTRTLCGEIDIMCHGSPTQLDTFSTTTVTIGNYTIGFLFLHTLEYVPTLEELQKTISILNDNSMLQIVYVHWGDEYMLYHNQHQENLAHTLIDLGIDAVIGHHPHVVQDVSLYNGKPIFYSLGNFIFDQYFSSDVQEGLVLKLELYGNLGKFTLLPVETKTFRASPIAMSPASSTQMFNRILSRIHMEDSVNVQEGTIVFLYP